MTVTATAPPGKDVWLFGLRDGMNLDGRILYNEAVKGGGFGEGGTSTSVHVKGGESTDITRVYPRGDDPIAPGTGVAAHLSTWICEGDSRSAPCHDATIAIVEIMTPAEGFPAIRIMPGKEPEQW